MAETKASIQFREQVIQGLSEVKTEVVNIVARLDKINGAVQRHEGELISLKVADAKHEGLITTVASLVSDVDKLKTVSTTMSTEWQMTSTAAKALWSTFGAGIIILFQRLPDILKLLESK